MLGSDFMDELDCGSFFDQIDDLIEFPADNDCGLGSGTGNDFPSIWSTPSDAFPNSDPIFSGNNSNSGSDLSAELSVPYEDMVQLEWLSNFMEDSFSGRGMTLEKENSPINKEEESSHNQFQTSSPVSVLESSSSSSTTTSSSSSGGKTLPLSPTQRGPQRARSKRPRPATFSPRPSIQLNPQSLPSPLVASSDSENVVESQPVKKLVIPKLPLPEHKKKKKIKLSFSLGPVETNENQNQNQNQTSQAVRKCMHCEITKTPQWRAGPMGPKTLCNACGVRYKSGRLFPEYRPAASPTFVPALHSNSHKKVLEMRSKSGDENYMAIAATTTEPELIPNSNPSLDYV